MRVGGGTASSHKRKQRMPGASVPLLGNVVRAPARAPTISRIHQRQRPGRTVPIVGNIVRAPYRAPKVARNQKAERQIQRAVRQRARYGASTYSGGGSEDLLAQLAAAGRAYERRMQRRGFGGAASYYRRHPGAGSSHSVYGTPIGFGGGSALQMRQAGFVTLGDIKNASRLYQQIGTSPTRQLQADVEARRQAPALKLLEQLQRPLYSVGGAVHGVKEGDPLQAAKLFGKGLLLQGEHYTPGEEIFGGVEGKLGTALRLGTDIVGDWSTYLGGIGLASRAGKTAITVGERTAASAAKAKLTALAPAVERGEITQRMARQIARETGRTRGKQAADRYLRKVAEESPEDLKEGLTVNWAGGRTLRKGARAATRKIAPGVERRIARTKRSRYRDQRKAAAPLTRLTAAVRRERAGTSDLAKFLRNTAASAHAGVRPVGATRREYEIEKQVGREGRAREDIAIEQANQTVRSLLKRLDPEDAMDVVDAYEAGKLGLLPERLRDVGVEIGAALRYVRRSERRGAVLSGDIGPTARSRDEVRLGPRAERKITNKDFARANRNIERAQENLEHLQQRYWRLREMDPTTSSPSHHAERAIAKNQADEAAEQVLRAKKDFDRLRAAAKEQKAAARQVREIRGKRLSEEARAYFPRELAEEVFGQKRAWRRIAHGELQSAKGATRAVAAKPKSESSMFREHRGTRAAMRAGSETERAIEAQFSKDVPGSLQIRAGKGGRAMRGSHVNRELADRLGKPLPKPSEISGEMMARMAAEPDGGRAIYRLEGSDLEELKPHQFKEARRAAMNWKDRAKADAKRRAYLKSEGFTREQIDDKMADSAARYVILPRNQVKRTRQYGEATRFEGGAIGEVYDAAARTFKSVALATLQYLVRNHGGDMFNAWTDENVFRLLRNAYGPSRSQRVLAASGKRAKASRTADVAKRRQMMQEMGRLQRAGNVFERMLKPGQRDVKLSTEQAREIAGPSGQRLYNMVRKDYVAQIRKEMPNATSKEIKQEMERRGVTPERIRQEIEQRLLSGKVSALHVAQLAEQYGVIGQGRFAEAMDMGRSVLTKRSNRWQRTVKRVEDSTRLVTFMGGLQRGMSFADAASRANRIHFDYGDLTPFEKNVMRRAFFFYTFPSRNIPFQAKQLATRPGKYANLEKVRQASAEAAFGEDREDWQADISSEFEARQLPFGVNIPGMGPQTASLGAPFTDLNDIASVVEGAYAIPRLATGAKADRDFLNLGIAPWKRALEMLGPYKTVPELIQNSSFYFHEDIAPKGNRLTDAPEWAKQASKLLGPNFDRLLGLKREGGTVKWDKRTPYALRSFQPGAIGAAGAILNALPGPGLGVKTGRDYRGRSQTQKLIGLTGVRLVDLNRKTARERRLYDERERIQDEMDDFRTLYKQEHPGKDWKDDPRYQRMLRQSGRLDDRIERVNPTKEIESEGSSGDPRLQRLREIRGGRAIQRDDPRMDRLRELRASRLK